MTGGGPGVMEAANRGAREAGGRSVGCNITLAHEQYPNRVSRSPRHLPLLLRAQGAALQVLCTRSSSCPGGLGTLDELTEALTLIQTGKIKQFPVVLMGTEYWTPFTDLLKEMVAHGTISVTDLDLFLVTDSVPEAIAHIDHHAIRRFGLTRRKGPPPRAALAVGRGAREAIDGRDLVGRKNATKHENTRSLRRSVSCLRVFVALTKSLSRDSEPDRAGDARAAVAAVAAGILREVLLVIALGEIELRRRQNLRA